MRTAHVLSDYYQARVALDAPITIKLADPRDNWTGTPAWGPVHAARRETLLLAVCCVSVALDRLSGLHRAVLEARHGRGRTDREIARALAVDVADAKALHVRALLALARELARLDASGQR